MRRMASVLVGCVLAAVAAGPASAAETYHARVTGDGAFAVFTNLDPETFDWENPAPGTYFQTIVDAGTSVFSDGGSYDPGVCVWYDELVIDGDGQYAGGSSLGGCGDATDFSLDRRLTDGVLQASIPVVDCIEWSEDGEECLDEAVLGTIEVDLAFSGTGDISRSHGASSGGTAGEYQYVSHGTSAERAATADGEVTFNGTSLVDGATFVDAQLRTSRDGWVDISVSGSIGG